MMYISLQLSGLPTRNMRVDHECVNTNTSVTAEDLLVHYGSDGQAVEAVGEGLPQLDVKSAFTCNSNEAMSEQAVRIKLLETVLL